MKLKMVNNFVQVLPEYDLNTGLRYRVVADKIDIFKNRSGVLNTKIASLNRGSILYLRNIRLSHLGVSWAEITTGTYSGNYVKISSKGEHYAIPG